jgi:hypothetical protein
VQLRSALCGCGRLCAAVVDPVEVWSVVVRVLEGRL